MTYKHIFKKITSLFIVFILVGSINLVLETKGVQTGTNEGEGYFHDDFLNKDYLGDLDDSNCVLNESEGKIYLKKDNSPIPFDYNHRPDSIELYETKRLFVSGINQWIGPNLGSKVDDEDKEGIAEHDKSAYSTECTKHINLDMLHSPIHHFRFKIKQDLEEIDKITLQWWFGDYMTDAYLKEIELYFWTYGSAFKIWQRNDKVEYKENIINDADSDLSYPFPPEEFVSDDGYVDVLVVGIPEETENIPGDEKIVFLNSDYIKLSLTTKFGYVPQGTITSLPISADNRVQWDKVIWSGSKPSSKSNVTIEVLNKNAEPISGLKSQKSPIDISSVESKEIILRAILKSSTIEITPNLDSWTVLYKREEGYNDKFTSSFRIDEINGLKNKNNKIEIDSYYGDWPIYGKEPDNTRSYEGNPIDEKPSGFYWFSYYNLYGGGFKAPVVSDGKVYVASANKRIYSFNEVDDNKKKNVQSPVDKSIDSYLVESSLAVSDDHVIFGTNNASKNNGIYALNKTNLKDEIWSYKPDGDIAFTASPTLYDERLIITSNSGGILDSPLFSVFGSLLGGNNKLIVLDEKTGVEVYDSIDLPAPSHSTPAVYDDKIFAACQNIRGSNLFAYDLLTGDELWNISTGSPYGIVGRSSPVYADGKIFVTCNQKESLFSTGKNMLIAVDASDGEILWNKSIGTPKISYPDVLKGIYSSAPISSPVYSDGAVYVVSTNGTFYALNQNNGNEKWSYDLKNESGSPLPANYYASPVIVDDKVYVVKGATVFCFNKDQTGTADLDWSYEISVSDYYTGVAVPPVVYCSPVYADGLLFISATHGYEPLTGAIYCIGNYNKNLDGEILSSSIEVPKGYWWENFNAEIESNENNSILFSILDSDKKYIDGFKNINGSNNNISNLNTNKIRLYANLEVVEEEKEYPVLDSWNIEWVKEDRAPVFNITTTDAWVNQDLLEYSVSVRDIKDEGIVSGLDMSSARYKVGYIPTGKDKPVYSKWFDAASNAKSGARNAEITAKVVDANLDIKELINISFKISDLAGNTATTNDISFRFDGSKPSSEISNSDEIDGEKFSSEPEIIVDVNDTGGSGIKNVFLKYRYSNSSEGPWGEWIDYSNSSSVFRWYFGLDSELLSGYYELVSIAQDNASNIEDITENKGVIFLFDTNEPSIDNNIGTYKTSELPIISIEISDDFKLDKLYYQTQSESVWVLIEENINKKTGSVEWSVPDDIWVDLDNEQEFIIYFKVVDLAGNEYVTDENNAGAIIKDKNATKTFLDLSDFSSLQTDDKFIISVTNIGDIVIDNVKLFYKYSGDEKEWDEDWTQFGERKDEAPYNWEFDSPNKNGFYKFKTTIEDTQGKTYVSESETVSVSVFPMLESIIFFVLFILAIIISLFVNAKLKSKKNEL